jgi:hypothetical protein
MDGNMDIVNKNLNQNKMTVFILIIFSLATFRTIVPLRNKEKLTLVSVVFAITHIIALWYLFDLLVTLKS